MIPIDSFALGEVARILRIRQEPGDPEFQGSVLQQVFDVGPAIRRALTFAGADARVLVMAQAHAGAGTLTTTRDLYALGGTPQAPWPPDVQRGQFDVWLLQAIAFSSAAGSLTAAMLDLQFTTAVDTAAGGIMPLATWNAEANLGAGLGVFHTLVGSAEITARIPTRIPRPGVTLRYRSTATGAITFTCVAQVALLPSTLGQDLVQ